MRALTQLFVQVLCLTVFASASTLSRGHHNEHERKHHSKSHIKASQDDSATFDQVYAGDFDVKKEVSSDQADDQMNVYVDKSYQPKYEQGAEQFDRYVQTSDQEGEESEEDEQDSDEGDQGRDFDPKTEVQLDQAVYEYMGEEFDPKSEVKLEQMYGGKEVVDSHNITEAVRDGTSGQASNKTTVAQTA
jgi:hypothetical protein